MTNWQEICIYFMHDVCKPLFFKDLGLLALGLHVQYVNASGSVQMHRL